MDTPTPTQIQVDTDAQTLTVEWADGHSSVFPLDRLRAACPCANCEGKSIDHIAPPDDAASAPDRQWMDLDIEPAGSIGIRITWDDGHNAGIFRWDRLRRLQPKREQ
jgi:DUF971 family protein